MPHAAVIRIEVGDLGFLARLERERAPRTVEALLGLLPLDGSLLQARWSGEAAWMPLGDLETGLAEEHATSEPAPGELLLYPHGISETEILFPYGQTVFASKFGRLRGNHVMTIIEGGERLGELGHRVVWNGAQPIRFSIGG